MPVIDELPFRCIDADDELVRLMAGRGETLADVLWYSAGCTARCSDFKCGVMRTTRHVYTVAKDDWLGDGAYTCRVIVARSTEQAAIDALHKVEASLQEQARMWASKHEHTGETYDAGQAHGYVGAVMLVRMYREDLVGTRSPDAAASTPAADAGEAEGSSDER